MDLLRDIRTTGVIEVQEPIQDSSNLQKFRIYTNLALTLPQMKVVAKQLQSNPQFYPWIDVNPYGVGQSIRCCNSFKYDFNAKKYQKRAYIVSKEEFPKTIITRVTDCVKVAHSFALGKDLFYDIELDNQAAFEALTQVLGPIFKGIKLDPLGPSSSKFVFTAGANKRCPSHPEVTHKTFGGVAWVEDKHVHLKCWTRNKICGGSVAKYDMPTELVKAAEKPRRVKDACE